GRSGRERRGSRHRRVYGQRWQAESAFSRHKRRLGTALGGRSDESRERECRLRVLTHNLMLLAATGYDFNRAIGDLNESSCLGVRKRYRPYVGEPRVGVGTPTFL